MELRVSPGIIAYQRLIEDRVDVVFLTAPRQLSLFGILCGDRVYRPVKTRAEIEETVMEAIAAKLDAAESRGV